MNVSIFHDMTCKLPLPGLLEGVANLIRTDEKLAVFTRSYRQTGSKTFKNESQLFSVACLFEGGKGRSNIRQLTGLSLVDFDHVVPNTNDFSKVNTNRTNYTNKVTTLAEMKLVLNLGHSPLYRHFCKCLYIEMLKISLVY